MSAELETIRLGPLGGLSGLRVADEGTLDTQRPLPMRGGYNAQVVDGEWWCRPAPQLFNSTRDTRLSFPWWWVIEHPASTTYAIVASPWYALQMNLSNGDVAPLYSTAGTVVMDVVAGQATASAVTAPTVGQLVLDIAGDSSFVHRVIDVSGVGPYTVTFDRVFEGSTGNAVTHRLINPIADPYGTGDDNNISGEISFRGRGSWCIFDQLVSHSGTTLGWANPAVTANHRYLVICSEFTRPKAIDLDSVSALVTDFFYDTSITTPTAVSSAAFKGEVCCTWQNRLVIGRAPDAAGGYGERTVWYCQIGDLLRWHNGVQGQTGFPLYVTFEGNSDKINAVAALGESLIVHREYSQEVGSPLPSASAVSFAANTQGIGLRNPRSLVVSNLTHYFWSDMGPARLTLQGGVERIGNEVRRHLESMGVWRDVVFGFDDPETSRLYWVAPSERRHQAAAIPAQAESDFGIAGSFDHVRAMVVHDYITGAWWFEDHVAIYGAGLVRDRVPSQFENGRTFVSRFDGSTVAWSPRSTSSGLAQLKGKEPGVTTGTHVVDALVDTPWLGFDRRRRIHSIELGLRALALTTGGAPSISDLWTLSTETLHLCTVEVYLDGDMTTPYVSQDVTKLVSEMLALTADENQQLPLMPLDCVHLDAAATSIKLRFKNALSTASTTAGYTKGMFRIAYIDLRLIPTETYRANDPDPGP